MPRIPIKPIPRETHISNFRLATPSAKDIRVAQARPTRIIDTGEGLFAGAVKDIGKAMKGIAEVFALKEEITRVAKSQHLQMDMNKAFREIKTVDSQRTSDQAAGMLTEFQDKESDFREDFISKDLDAKTTKELTEHFDRKFTGYAAWIVQHTIQQSGVADQEARLRTIENAHTNIASLVIGDISSLETEITEVLQMEIARHPNLTKGQIETNRRALREDFVTFATTKWIIDNPTAAVAFWDTNKEYIKKATPKVYNTLASKIDIAREDSKYDLALTTLQRTFKEDTASAARFVEEDEKGILKLTPTQRLKLSSTLWATHRYKEVEKERVRKQKEEQYFQDSHKKYYDPKTGATNVQEALADLEQKYRDGTVDLSTYNIQKDRFLKGGEFSNEQSLILMSLIDDQKVTTYGEILQYIAGTTAKPEPFYKAVDARKKQIDKGFTTNWFKESYTQFQNLAKIKKAKDLPSSLGRKELLVDVTKLPDFKEDLETEARSLGYSAGDPRIKKIAKDLLTSGWYSKTSPEFQPGKAPWGTWGEKYLRKYEYDPEQLFEEGKIHRMPEGETATRGNPIFDKLMQTPEGQEAYTRLLEEDITPDVITLQQAIEIIAGEKRE